MSGAWVFATLWAQQLEPTAQGAAPPPPAASEPEPAPPAATAAGAPITVTATLDERPASESPAPVIVVSGEALARTGASDVAGALASAPGVTAELVSDEARGGGTSISLQGFDSKRVLVLINGRPLAGDSDGAVDLSVIPTRVVERVEIVAGPLGALYGGGTIGGVVNVITVQPTSGASSLGAASSLRLGSYNAIDASQSVSASRGRVGVLGVASVSSSDGFDLDPSWPDTDGASYTRTSVWTSLGLHPSDPWHVQLDLWAQSAHRARVLMDARYLDTLDKLYFRDLVWDEQRLTSTLSFGYQGSALGVSGWVSGSAAPHLYRNQIQGALSATERDSDMRQGSTRLELTWVPTPTLATRAGVESRGEALEVLTTTYDELGQPSATSEEVPASAQSRTEVFVLADKTLWQERVELYGGSRLLVLAGAGARGAYPPSTVSLRVSPIDGLNLRGSLGLGYRAPTLKELYYDFDHSAFGYVVIGNPDLRIEQSLSAQASVELDTLPRGLVRVGGFFHDVVDLIDFVQVPEPDDDGNLVFQLDNIGAAVVQGVDALGTVALGPLDLTASYQLLDARDKATGLHLLYRSAHSGRVGLSWEPAELPVGLSAAARYQGPQYVSDDADAGGQGCDPSSYLAGEGGGWDPAQVAEIEDRCYVMGPGFTVVNLRSELRARSAAGLNFSLALGVDNLGDVARPAPTLEQISGEEDYLPDPRPAPGRVFYLSLQGEM